MPTSTAAPPTTDRSPPASDSDEYEYEEVEIEEEIEVEEEVSDDDDDEEEEEEEEEEEFEEVEDEEEAEEEEEAVEQQQQPEEQQDKGSEEDASRPIEDLDEVKGTEKIISDGEKASQCGGGVMTAETTNIINESSKQVTVGDSVDESDKVPHSEEQTTQMNIKDVSDAHQKEPRLDVDAPLIRPRSLSPAMEEINEGNKRQALVCDFFAKGWCIKGSSCRFLHVKDTPQNVVDQKNDPQKSQPQDEGVREGTGRSDLATSAAAPTLTACSSESKPGLQKDNSNPVTNPRVNKSVSNMFMGPNSHRSNWASYAPKMEEFGGKEYRFGRHNHNNYNSSYHGTVWPRGSTFLSSSSWKSNSKFSSYDWEPSKPFKSQFLISQGISAPDIQYDPILDSIEQPTEIGDKLPKLSSSSRVPSISGTHSALQEKLKTDNGSERFSIGSHVNGYDNDMDMDMDSNEIADTKQENTKSESKGKKHVGDVIQASEVNVSSHDGRATKEGNSFKLDFDADGDMHRESKSLRHFRAALIEFVKELVRPTWRDGKLSKDAHKMIVKKTVDKVLTSLPPEHIPNIQESVDTYLTSSQPKLVKLVEGYIEKYGKL